MFTFRPAVRWFALLAAIACVSSPVRTGAQSLARIVAPIKNEVRVTVKDSTPALVKRSVDTGRMAGGQNLGRMILSLTPTAEQEQAAAQLVTAQHDASSPLFHKWLTPAQYGEKFGVAADDATKVQQWLQQQGMTVHEISQSRRFVVFSGTVGQVEQAFSTQMHSYTLNNQKFVANSTDIQLPAALSAVVKGVVRLHSDPRSPDASRGIKVHFKKHGAHFTFDDGSHYLAPADFAKIYNLQPLYDAGIDGTGQTIAIVGRSNIDVSNVHDFRSILGLPENNPEIIVNGDDPGQQGEDMAEAMLDVTWSGAVAPMARIKFVVSQSNFSDGIDVSAAYIVDHNLAPIMSTSFGSCEESLGSVGNAFYNSLWNQAAAQGITSFVSAGDNGGAGCDNPWAGLFASGGLAVSGITSTPYNVSVGGTQFDDVDNPDAYWMSVANTDPATGLSALGYIPEKVWNESTNDPYLISLGAGSGGVSKLYPKPDWQAAPGVPNDGKRDVPDFSLSAASHVGYLVCLFNYCSLGDYFYAFGGTSASSPAAAGIMALVNQKLNGQPQGIANYVIYKLASFPGVFHDITKGDNQVPDEFGQFTVGYSAGTGYDLATGLGSFDAAALVNNWEAASTAIGTSTTLTLGNGQSATAVHGAPITMHSTVVCSSGGTCTAPTGSVSLLATTPAGDGLAAGLGQLVPGTPSTVSIQTRSVPGGSMTITARYSGDAHYYASTSGPINVTVTPEASQTFLGMISGGYINDTPISVNYGLPVPLGVAVAGQSGFGYPSGIVNLTADGQSIEPAKYSYDTGSWLPYPIVLNYGEKSTLLTVGSNPASQSSSISTLAPGIAAGPHQLVASYPGDNSFGTSKASYNFTVTKADSMFQDFFPVGSLVANAPVKLDGQIGLVNQGWAPFGGTVTITDITDATPVVLGVGQVDSNVYGSFPVVVTFRNTGTRLIKAEYSGDANLNPTTSTYHMPIPASSSSYVSVGSDTASAIAGSAVTLMATIGSDIRLYGATGTATFLNGTTTLGTAPVVATYLVPGDPTTISYVATLVTKVLPPGANNISANYSGDSILQASSGGPAVVMIADYTLQAQPSTLTIPSGQSGTATLTILPIAGSTQTVQVSCGTLPVNISCSLAPGSVTLDGTSTASVKITVTAKTTAAGLVTNGHALGVASSLAFAALLLPFWRRNRLKALLGVAVIIVIGFYGAGCGSSSGSSTNAAKGLYVLNITTTSTGSAAKTTPLVINVQ